MHPVRGRVLIGETRIVVDSSWPAAGMPYWHCSKLSSDGSGEVPLRGFCPVGFRSGVDDLALAGKSHYVRACESRID